MRRICVSLLPALVTALVGSLHAQPAFAQPAFPGATGFGAAATGGRGGDVHIVTSLDADGSTPGTLQWALNQSGPRVIVFEVSGVIAGDISIPNGDVTIAGQTAPGAGITINGHLTTPYGDNVSNIIIRHLRVRPPGVDANWPGAGHDAIQFSDANTVILDHIDVSHGVDENVDLWNGAHTITVQWSVLSFARVNGHPEGQHNYCLINSVGSGGAPNGGKISIHHNLFAHCRTRTPALAVGPAEVINNVVYNVREGFVHHNEAFGDFNLVGNYYRAGSDASLAPFWFDPENANPPTSYWLEDNWVDDPGTFEGRVDNPWDSSDFVAEYSFHYNLNQSYFNQAGVHDFSGESGWVPTATSSPAVAYDDVLGKSGAFPRDFVTLRAVDDTRNRGGNWQDLPLNDLLDGLTPGASPADADRDGMADDWENANGLNPADGSDHSTVRSSGYTAIEDYINGLADDLAGQAPGSGGTGGGSGTGGSGTGGGSGAGGSSAAGGAAGGSGSAGSSGSSGDAGSGNSAGAGGGSEATPPGSDDGGGCGCTAPAGGSSSGGLACLALLGLVLGRRRRSR